MADSGNDAIRPLPAVAMLGDAFVDVQVSGLRSLPSWGQDVTCKGIQLLAGGSCANAARHLASLGRDQLTVSFCSALGDDDLGRYFLSKLREEGLLARPDESIAVLEKVPQSTCVVLSGQTDRAMVSCYSSNRLMRADHFAPLLLRGGDAPFRHLHIGGYFGCTALHTEAFLDLVRSLRASGARVSLDTQYDSSEKWTGVDGHLAKLLPLLDVFLFNEEEAAGIARATGAFPVPAAANAAAQEAAGEALQTTGADGHHGEHEDALAALAAAHPQALVVIKRGHEGVVCAQGRRRWRVGAFGTDVADTTGAGDAFNAGFILKYVADPADVPGALRSGNAAGGLCVSVEGACAVPLERGAVEQLAASVPMEAASDTFV